MYMYTYIYTVVAKKLRQATFFKLLLLISGINTLDFDTNNFFILF